MEIVSKTGKTVVLPWNLADVVKRCARGTLVYGFELELLADFYSRQ